MLTFLDEVKPTELFSNVYSHKASESAKSVADDSNVTFKPYANKPSSLFTHKCLMLDHEKAEVYFNNSEETEADTEKKSQILNNCKLEIFLTDCEHILQRILTTKVSLNENQTTLNEISLLISISSQIVMKSLSLFKQTSSRLDFIKEENMFNTAMLLSLNVFKLVQTDQSAEASHQVSDLSEATEVTDHEDSFFSDHLSLSEAQGLLVDAQTQMLDPGLATLSF